MRRVLLICGAVLAALPGTARAKGVVVEVTPDRVRVDAGEVVTVSVRLTPEPGVRIGTCPQMRLDAVAPGIRVPRALAAVEGRGERIGAWGAFRVASLRRGAGLTWTGRIRPGTTGTWTLVVPNLCADGYVTPSGWASATFTVAP